MKKLLSAILLGAIVFTSCTKKETPEPSQNNTTLGYNFIDQPLQGKIEGVNWNVEFGIVEYETFFDGDYFFSLYNVADTNHCDGNDPNTDYVLFAISNPEVGIIDFENSSQSVTLYDKETQNNIGAFFGAIEILTIDTTNTMTITGRMDVRETNSSSTNYMNGNFSVTYCK